MSAELTNLDSREALDIVPRLQRVVLSDKERERQLNVIDLRLETHADRSVVGIITVNSDKVDEVVHVLGRFLVLRCQSESERKRVRLPKDTKVEQVQPTSCSDHTMGRSCGKEVSFDQIHARRDGKDIQSSDCSFLTNRVQNEFQVSRQLRCRGRAATGRF